MPSTVDLTTVRKAIAENREWRYFDYERWKSDHDTALRSRLGDAGVEAVRSLEKRTVSHDVVMASEVFEEDNIRQRARDLVDNYKPEKKKLRQGEAADNARSALFEALVASGHMSVVELPGDVDTVHGQVMERLLNSYYREGVAVHEINRNFVEICEELRIKAVMDMIVNGQAPPDTKVVTVSDYADPLGAAADKHGYRTKNLKGMVRETSLIWKDGQWTRVIKQISRSNALADVTVEVLKSLRLRVVNRYKHNDLNLLDSQMLSVKYGALEVTKLIDSGKLRYGELLADESPDYDSLEQRSRERESFMNVNFERLAAYEKKLDDDLLSGKITALEHRRLYVEKVREHVRAICVRFPEYTKDALGDAVVVDYERAHNMYISGDTAGAGAVVSSVSSRESAIVICGGSTETSSSQSSSQDQNSLQSVLEQMKMREKRWIGCPCCHKSEAFYGDPCDPNMDCRHCGAYTRDGKLIYSGDGGYKTEEKSLKDEEAVVSEKRESQDEMVRRIYGPDVRLELRKTVGRVAFDVVDRCTGRAVFSDVLRGA